MLGQLIDEVDGVRFGAAVLPAEDQDAVLCVAEMAQHQRLAALREPDRRPWQIDLGADRRGAGTDRERTRLLLRPRAVPFVG